MRRTRTALVLLERELGFFPFTAIQIFLWLAMKSEDVAAGKRDRKPISKAVMRCLADGAGRGFAFELGYVNDARGYGFVVLVVKSMSFGEHALMQDAGNQNAAMFLPVKHDMFAGFSEGEEVEFALGKSASIPKPICARF